MELVFLCTLPFIRVWCACVDTPCNPFQSLMWHWWTMWLVSLSTPAHIHAVHAISCSEHCFEKGVQHSSKCLHTSSCSWNRKDFPSAFLFVHKGFLNTWERDRERERERRWHVRLALMSSCLDKPRGIGSVSECCHDNMVFPYRSSFTG